MSIKTVILGAATKIKVHSPAILLVGGIAAIVGGTVAACVATTKLEPVVDKAKEDLDLIRDREAEGALKEGEAPKLKTQCYLRTAARVTGLYSIPAALVAGGVTMILVSHHILTKRNAALVATCQATMSAFNRYRRNVVAKYGKAEDYACYNGDYTRTDEQHSAAERKDKLVRAERDVPWHADIDRCFDESNPNFRKDATENQYFLKCQQNYINDRMMSRRSERLLKNGVLEVHPGFISATEVWEISGWYRPEDYRQQDVGIGKMTDGACDPNQPDYFDYGIFETDDEGAQRFVKGIERSVWLHPNFDGYIADKIGVPLYFKDGVRCDKHGNPL